MDFTLEDPCNLVSFEQNVFATIGQILLWVPLILYLEKSKKPSPTFKPRQLNAIDHFLGALLILFTIINIITRIYRGVTHWLFQPCHIITLMEIFMIYNRNGDSNFFTFVLYSNWMPVLGLVFYDPNWYYYFFELPMFHLQHVLMIVIPWYYVATRVFQKDFNPNRWQIFLQAVGVSMIYHATVLIWMSHLYLEDFSGMRCRFPGGEFAGKYWREVQVVFGTFLSAVFGVIPEFFILKAIHLLSSKKQDSKKTT